MGDIYSETLRTFLKPVVQYLDDPSVSEIMINGPTDVWIERKGKLFKTDARFTSEGLLAAARNMAQFVGRIITDERPRLDARLPDGSRIHVVLPPMSRKGVAISIRKFFPSTVTMEQYVGFGAVTTEGARFLEGCVATKQNLIVAGGTGSGKTTLLNILSQFIPNNERILTIEDSAELKLNQEHLLPLEARPPDAQGKGAVTIGDLLHSSLRLRPDRIVIGEVRGAEAFDLMQALNTGHGGSMCTTHANTPTETLRRIESLCLMNEVQIPLLAVRAQVAAAINTVVCCARFSDGSRRITHIGEVLPLNEKGDYRTQDIFLFVQTGKDKDGKVLGYFSPTGILPTFFDRLQAYGFKDMNESFFDPDTYGFDPPPVTTIAEDFKVRWVRRLEIEKKLSVAPPKQQPPSDRELTEGFQIARKGKGSVKPDSEVHGFEEETEVRTSPGFSRKRE